MSIFFRASVPPVIERAILIAVLSTLALLCWILLWKGGDFTHITHSINFSHHSHHSVNSSNFIALFVAGWAVMTVAMMLPTTLPIIAIFHKISYQHKNRILLLILVLLGYIGTWLVFGILIFILIKILTLFISTRHVLSSYSWTIAPLVILSAGLFQFSSLKYKCLDKCRSPLSFVMERWKGSRDKWNALRLGIDHGIFCIGCCWALMLLMFVVGYSSLLWMLVLAIVMGIEKNAKWGRKISKPVGVSLILLGLSMFMISYHKIF